VPIEPQPKKAPKQKIKASKSRLKVVFDTNALYVTPTSLGSASDLVRQEIADLIAEAKYPDLELLWFLPEVVRHERQYQMQAEAMKLRSAINRIERLLGHNLALTDEVLLNRVDTAILAKASSLGLTELKLNHELVDWSSLIKAATYRLPPFQPGEKEKGFRDAIVLESFLQLVSESPKTPQLCRVVLVTSDALLKEAVEKRIADSINVSVLSDVEELKGLINTLVSDVTEDFIAALRPKARKLFFTSDKDKDTLYYKADIGQQLKEKFATELTKKPEGASFRKDGTWYINSPNFAKKEGRRIFWNSRVEIEVESGKYTPEDPSGPVAYGVSPGLLSAYANANAPGLTPPWASYDDWKSISYANASAPTFALSAPLQVDYNSLAFVSGTPSTRRVVTHKGRDIYEVLWSAEVSMDKDLKKGKIEEIRHIELAFPPTA
jgi:hypothetical protein